MALSAIQGVTMSTLKAEMESVSTDQALWLQNWEANKWSDIDENGVSNGTFAYDPVVVSLPNNKIHSFATTTNSELHHKWYSPSTGWSNWVMIANESIAPPTAIAYGADKVAVFVVGKTCYPYVWFSTSDTAFTKRYLGTGGKPIRAGSFSSCLLSTGHIIVVAVEQGNGQVMHTWMEPSYTWTSEWIGWPAGFSVSKPVIVSCKPGCRDIFIFGASNSLMRMAYREPAGWGTWQDCGGGYQYEPTAVSVSPGRIDVFCIGFDGQLYQSYVTVTGSEVGTLTKINLGGTSISSPKTTITAPGVFSVTTKKTKGVYQQKFFESSTGVWTPQDSMTVVQAG